MKNPLQHPLDRTKKFVKDHQMVLACTTTAVVTAVITRDLKVRGVQEVIDIAWTMRNEAVDHTNHVLDFIDEKNLTQDFQHFLGSTAV